MRSYLLRWLLPRVRAWAIEQPETAIVMHRHDGKPINVACVFCSRCRNYFWMQHEDIQPPACCPFCIKPFAGAITLTNAEMERLQVS